jgi:hypothetical protein
MSQCDNSVSDQEKIIILWVLLSDHRIIHVKYFFVPCDILDMYNSLWTSLYLFEVL